MLALSAQPSWSVQIVLVPALVVPAVYVPNRLNHVKPLQRGMHDKRSG
jgi:hypothetical protein